MFEYDAESMAAAEMLNKYDLTDVLKNIHGADVYEVLDCLDELGNDEISESIHNLTTDEFVTYLETRYKMRSEEVVHYALWWNRRP